MPSPTALPIQLKPSERAVLEKIVRSHTSEQRLVRRAQILLKAHAGDSNAAIARALDVNRETVQRWRHRWSEAAATRPDEGDEESRQGSLSDHIYALLMDRPRPGTPATFSAEQVVRIVALACEDPQTAGFPVTEWTPRELAEAAMRRGIVEQISARSVERFLKRGPASTPPQPLLA